MKGHLFVAGAFAAVLVFAGCPRGPATPRRLVIGLPDLRCDARPPYARGRGDVFNSFSFLRQARHFLERNGGRARSRPVLGEPHGHPLAFPAQARSRLPRRKTFRGRGCSREHPADLAATRIQGRPPHASGGKRHGYRPIDPGNQDALPDGSSSEQARLHRHRSAGHGEAADFSSSGDWPFLLPIWQARRSDSRQAVSTGSGVPAQPLRKLRSSRFRTRKSAPRPSRLAALMLRAASTRPTGIGHRAFPTCTSFPATESASR